MSGRSASGRVRWLNRLRGVCHPYTISSGMMALLCWTVELIIVERTPHTSARPGREPLPAGPVTSPTLKSADRLRKSGSETMGPRSSRMSRSGERKEWSVRSCELSTLASAMATSSG